MSVFRFAAPLFKLVARRWSDDDFRALADLLRPFVAPGGSIADLGGGTGDIGIGVARALDARVIVVDQTPQMLKRVGPDPVVSVRLASAQSLPFPAGYFDAVLVCDAFHHFQDQERAAAEIARVVRPGGGVLILDAEPTGANRWVTAVERLLGEPGGMRSRGELEALLATQGIAGATTATRGSGYYFLGSIGDGPQQGRGSDAFPGSVRPSP